MMGGPYSSGKISKPPQCDSKVRPRLVERNLQTLRRKALFHLIFVFSSHCFSFTSTASQKILPWKPVVSPLTCELFTVVFECVPLPDLMQCRPMFPQFSFVCWWQSVTNFLLIQIFIEIKETQHTFYKANTFSLNDGLLSRCYFFSILLNDFSM